MRSVILLVLGLSISTAACAAADAADSAGQSADFTAAPLLVDGSPDAAGVVALLADPATTFDVVRAGAGLDARAAGLVIGHRDGLDGVRGTADDDPIGSLYELGRIPYVGPASIDKLARYARARGFVPTGDDDLGTFEGVTFTVDEAKATLALVNDADATRLEGYGLSARAAMILGSASPLDTVLALSEVPYIGPAALEILKAKAAD